MKAHRRIFPYFRVSVNEVNAYCSDTAWKTIEEEKRAH